MATRTTTAKRRRRAGRGARAGSADREDAAAAPAPEATLAAALAVASRRQRSERDLRARLAAAGHEQTAIDGAVERLRRIGLVDDAAFARAFAERRDRASPRAGRVVAGELRRAGVAAALAAEAASELSDEDAAARLAERRVRGLAGLDEAAFRARLAGYLRRRGFGWETVSRAVAAAWRRAGAEGGPAGGE